MLTLTDTEYHPANPGLIPQQTYDLEMDKLGIITSKVLYKCAMGDELLYWPAIWSAHPDFDILLCEKVRSWRADNWAWMEVNYAGAILPGQHEYELIKSTGEEPITTHPNFSNANPALALASTGKPFGVPRPPGPVVGPPVNNWVNGAVFIPIPGASGYLKFLGFDNADPSAVDSLYGVESYLDSSQVTWRHSYIDGVAPADLSGVGSIGVPDSGVVANKPVVVPNMGKGRNWLYLSCEWVRRGYIYQIQKQWRCSGRRGWNSKIYASPGKGDTPQVIL